MKISLIKIAFLWYDNYIYKNYFFMARRKYSLDEKNIERFLSEGRGKSSGADCKLWLSVQDNSANSRTI